MDEAATGQEQAPESEAGEAAALIEMANGLLMQAVALKEHYRALEKRLGTAERAAGERPRVRPLDGPPSPDEDPRRRVAINLALSGTPRTDADAYLRETFESSDHDHILDEVFGGAAAPEASKQRRRFARRR